MAQFQAFDPLGSLSRGEQFAQQQALRPIELDQARQATQFNTLKQQGLEQEIAQRTDDQKNIDFVNSALRLQSLPDEQLLTQLQSNRKDILSKGGDTADTDLGIQLAQSGRFDELRQGINSIVSVGERQGIIKAAPVQKLSSVQQKVVAEGLDPNTPEGQARAKELNQSGKTTKPTASAQDFETFKKLNAKALKTKDPIDIQLAEQFGRQSGFDRDTPQELADIEVSKESKKALLKQSATASKEAFDNLKKVRLTVANIDDAIKALDKGASTGPIVSKLPSFRQASIELNNIKGRMGLDVVGATTFGALSESELAFALDTALPDSLEPAALKDWLIRKKDSQTKLANELRKAASFLGTPGNTIADYIAQQEKENPKNLSDEDLFN